MMNSMFFKMWRSCLTAMTVAVFFSVLVPSAEAARERKVREGGEGAVEARRLLDKAKELMDDGDFDRALKMYQSIIEQHPKSESVHPAALEIGRHYSKKRDYEKAIQILKRLRALEPKEGEKPLVAEKRDWFLESLYLTGVAYFNMRRYPKAFPVLRKITKGYVGTVWANQAYYYIGMCHFAQENWSKAIEALGMVGAFVDPDSPAVEYMEAGRRFYVRVEDRDLPILARLKKKVKASVATTSGDKEQVMTIPLADGSTVIGSLPTAVGVPKPGDGILQVQSGDTITSTYTDLTDEKGAINVPRKSTVKVVSNGAISFMKGDLKSTAGAAYLGSPCFMLLLDADLDVSDRSDVATVNVICRYVQAASEDKGRSGEKVYVTRDQVKVSLKELGSNAVVRTGRFSGQVKVEAVPEGEVPVQNDAILSCVQGDEIVVTYIDKLGITGPSRRMATASLEVLGPLESRPVIAQDVVIDPLIRARKGLVEAEAYLELGRIFKSMGLIKGAADKVAMGLDRSEMVIGMEDTVPVALRHKAFKLTWELQLVANRYSGAMATCKVFNKLYPESPLVDDAMIGMGKAHMENGDYKAAISAYSQVLALKDSRVKGKAQFRIGEAIEARGKEAADAAKTDEKRQAVLASSAASAAQAYKLCAEKYPETTFASKAIEKVVDYYIKTRDFAQATTMLKQVFSDHPDADYLDAMYLKWTLVAFQSRDYATALEKCDALIMEYPDSKYAPKARKIRPTIQRKAKGK
ncbi:MAG: tetratricopeptide repeat protein [Lentisphaeria bacterium]|nr:tetratricopeptide repeat protein [Lentisphaeria bacterium]